MTYNNTTAKGIQVSMLVDNHMKPSQKSELLPLSFSNSS